MDKLKIKVCNTKVCSNDS